MAQRFTPVWREAKSGRTDTGRPEVRRAGSRPGAAGAAADAESGSEAATETRRQALFALKVMRERGHMTQEDYDRRRAAILQS